MFPSAKECSSFEGFTGCASSVIIDTLKRQKIIITVAIKFFNSKFTDFRSDEQRKVVILVMLLENILLNLIIMIIGPGNCTIHRNVSSKYKVTRPQYIAPYSGT